MIRLGYAFLAGALTLLTLGLSLRHHNFGTSDIEEYWNTCQAVARGGLPAVSFPLEYPPMSALVFAGPRLMGANIVGRERYYQLTFMLMAMLAAVGTAPSAAAIAPRVGIAPSLGVWRYCFVILSLFFLVLARYDIFPALCTMLALRCLLQERPAAAGAWLGMAVALKLYPVVLLPIFILYPLVRGKPRDAVRILLFLLAVNLLPLLPYFALHSIAFLSFTRFHRLRGLQVESLPSAFVLLAGKLKLTTVSIIDNFGAHHVVSPLADVLRRWQPIAAFLVLWAVTMHALWRMCRDVKQIGDVSAQTMIDESLIVLLTFIVTNKVFSPQYLVWIAPLLPLTSRGFYRAGVAICVVSLCFFLKLYTKMIDGHAYAIVLINLRNAAVAGLVLGMMFRSANQNPASENARRAIS